jgi:uncharacterized protein (TIGR03435 family)
MIADLSNHLWQSTLFAVAAALVAAALRRNRAAVRSAVWLAASLKFLVPFSLFVRLGTLLAPAPAVPSGPIATAPAVAAAIDQLAQPFSDALAAATSPALSSSDWTLAILTAIWSLGVGMVAFNRWRGWQRIRAALRASRPATIQGLDPSPSVEMRSSSRLLGPGIVGIWRPVLLVPDGLDRHLTPPQLNAVLAHELHHVQRRDNLIAAAHMVVEAVFWFHPVVWWIGARLVDERERACDEHVLRRFNAPLVYAEGILEVCKLYAEPPLPCVSGVTGSNLRRRVEDIMVNRIGLHLDGTRRTVLAVAAIAAFALPIAVGVMTAPLHAQSPPAATQDPASRPKFEVASIKPCDPQPVPPGGRTGGGGSGQFSPGRAYLDCFVVRNLVSVAYIGNRAQKDASSPLNNWPGMAGFVRNVPGEPQQIRGGPAWVYSDKYTIEAKAEGLDPTLQRGPDRGLMLGPMLRALLEERFQLKVHQEIEEVPMFALTVAKGGLKIKPMAPGACTSDRSNGPVLLSDAARLGVKPTCGTVNGGPNGPNWRYEHGGQTLAVVATMLSADLGVKVLDRTGVTDIFNISWEYGPDDSTPGSLRWLATYRPEATPTPPTAASVFKALEEQLGLKLERIKGPRAYIVIDRIERPTPDAPSLIAAPPPRASGAGARARR